MQGGTGPEAALLGYTMPTLFGGKPRINFAKVVIPNVAASKGVIHDIYSVLVPLR